MRLANLRAAARRQYGLLLGILSSRPGTEGAGNDWIFGDEILSAVDYAECQELAGLARGATVLELGSYFGRSTIALASTASVVHSVDPHDGGPPEAPSTLGPFLENLERHGVRSKVIVHVGLSTDVVPLFRPETFDMAFVDAMHQRPQVDIDLALAAGCLRPGGRIAFHDYAVEGVRVDDIWHPFGVTEAVQEFTARAGVNPPEVTNSLAVVRSPDLSHGPLALQRWYAAVQASGSAGA